MRYVTILICIFHFQSFAFNCNNYFVSEVQSTVAAKQPTFYSIAPTKVRRLYELTSLQKLNILNITFSITQSLSDAQFIRLFGFHRDDLMFEYNRLVEVQQMMDGQMIFTKRPPNALEDYQVQEAFDALQFTLKQNIPSDVIGMFEPIRYWRELIKSSTQTGYSHLN